MSGHSTYSFFSARTSFRDKQLDLVIRIYFWGMLIAATIAVVSVWNQLSATIIFITGCVHMAILILAAWGIRNKPYILTQAGNRVQSAGYLHTLIGFSVAVASLLQTGAELNNLAIPLASALVTSLLGWLFGGEISAGGEADNPSLEKATENIIQTLNAYSDELVRIQKNHSQQMEQDAKRIMSMQEHHAKKLAEAHVNNANALFKFYEGYNLKLDSLYRDIDKNSKAISQKFSEFAKSTEKNKTTIETSFDGFAKSVDKKSKTMQDSLQSYKTATAEVSSQTKRLAASMQELNRSSKVATQEVSSTVQEMKKVSAEIQKWSQQSNNSVTQVKQTISSMQELARYIMKQQGQKGGTP